MNTRRQYRQAPITEAIIDIRVQPRPDLKSVDLEHSFDCEASAYPKRERIFEVTGTFQAQPGTSSSASAEQKQVGLKLTDSANQHVLQVRLNGFTLSRLAPYETWELFSAEARRLWDVYRRQLQPSAIQRLAVRYINRIDIPTAAADLKMYFRTSPEISPDLPQRLMSFFMQLRIPQDDLETQALINQTAMPPPRDGIVAILLDIDLFRESDLPKDETGLWNLFEKLHVRKNEVFEACITDKTRELFN